MAFKILYFWKLITLSTAIVFILKLEKVHAQNELELLSSGEDLSESKSVLEGFNDTRLPRQEEGGDEGGDDGDGEEGFAAGLFGANGALGGGFSLPPVVPQILGSLTQAFTGANNAINATSGQPSIPSFLFSQFSNFVGQFTGQKPAAAATPPPYYPIAPGALRPGQGPGVLIPSQVHGAPPYLQRPVQPVQGVAQYPQLRPGHDPIVSQNVGGPNYNNLNNEILNGQQQSIPVRPGTQSHQGARPPNKVRSPRPKPRPKPGPSQPPKSSLWNIYKSFSPAPNPGGLTDFQLAHPEGFHSELLNSLTSSLSKGRGTTEKSTNNSPNEEPSPSDIQQSSINNHQGPQGASSSSNQQSRPSNPSQNNLESNGPPIPIATTPPSSRVQEIESSSSQETSPNPQDELPASNNLPQKPVTERLPPKLVTRRPSGNQGQDPVYPNNFKEFPAPSNPWSNRPVKPSPAAKPMLPIYDPEPASKPSKIFQNLPNKVTLLPELLSVLSSTEAPLLQNQPDPSQPETELNNWISHNRIPLSPSVSIPFEPEWPSSASGSSESQGDIIKIPNFISKPLTPIEDQTQQQEPIKSTGPTRNKVIVPNESSQTPSKNTRPVIINNMYYPNLEAAFTNGEGTTSVTTSKPRRKRRSSTTTPVPVPESDYYDEEPASESKSKRRRLVKAQILN